MYSEVEEYKNILKSDEQQYDAYIVLENGTKVDTDISGFRPIYNLGEKIIGNFATKKIEFTLFNTSKYNITNKEIEVFVGLKINNEFNYISLGKFIADKPVIKDETQDECTISATNYSLKFKVPYTPILTFPCTINEAIKDICEHLNIEYIENNFINKDYVLQDFFIEEDATFFDVIKILVEAGFANAIITNTNSLIVKSPGMTADYELSLNELFDLKKEDNLFGPINSIVASRIVADDGTTTEDVYKKDEDSINANGLHEYKIIQNEAIDYDRQTAVNNMLAGILNFEYNPAKIEAVYNPAIEIGDMLEVPDKKTATSFLLFTKEIIADLSSGLMTIESTEKTQTETDYKSATAKDKRKNTEIKVNKMEGKITQLVEETDENSQKLAQIEVTVDGITQTVSSIEGTIEETITNVDVMYALSDGPTIAPTEGWSTEAPQWENGKYMWQKTVTTYGDETTKETEPTCISGAKGEKGDSGENGADGKTSYFHIKYSSVESPTNSQMSETPNKYIGTYVDFNPTDSTDPSDYTWSRFEGLQGEKGENGIPGTNGENGKTSYLHIAYATNSTGTTGFSTTDSTNKTYIGQYTDFTQADSTDPSKYNWTLIKGDKGEPGVPGQDGATGAKGEQGEKGDTGIGVKKIEEQYYLSESSTTQTGGSWKTTQDPWVPEKYIWTRNKITWTDDNVTYTTPILAEGINNANSTANDVNNNLTNNYYNKTEFTSQMEQTAEMYDYKLLTVNGVNQIQNSTLEQGFDINNTMSGDVSILRSLDVKNNTVSKSAIKINNGYIQTDKIYVRESTEYTFSCLIWKNELTNVTVQIITDKTETYEIECEPEKFTRFSFTFSTNLKEAQIKISSDNNYCLVADRMLNVGNTPLGWQLCPGEIISENIKLTNQGIIIESSTSKTKWIANSYENKVVNKDTGEDQVVFNGDLTTLNRVFTKDRSTLGKLRATVLDNDDVILSFDD